MCWKCIEQCASSELVIDSPSLEAASSLKPNFMTQKWKTTGIDISTDLWMFRRVDLCLTLLEGECCPCPWILYTARDCDEPVNES